MTCNTNAVLFLPGEGEGWRRVEVTAFWPLAHRRETGKARTEVREPATVYLPVHGNEALQGLDLSGDCYLLRGGGGPAEGCTLRDILNAGGQMVTAAAVFDFGRLPHWELEVVR